MIVLKNVKKYIRNATKSVHKTPNQYVHHKYRKNFCSSSLIKHTYDSKKCYSERLL